MRRYNREEEVEDYDYYATEGEYQDDVMEDYEDEYEEEEDEEEEETRQPTQEEVKYLELRQRLKESIRRKRKHGAAASSEKKLPYNNFGSFFGPSQPIIAQRVIQESQSLLENQNLVSKMFSSNQSSKRNSSSSSAGPKLGQQRQAPKPVNELRKKVEKLKNGRDYSFLLNDAGVPVPATEPPARNVSAPTSEARSAQMLPRHKQPLSSISNSGRNSKGIHDERKSVPLKGQLQSKVGPYSSSATKSNGMSVDSKKQLGVSNGMGPGRPGGVSNDSRRDRHIGASNGSGPGRPGGANNGVGAGRPGGASKGSGPGRPGGVSNDSGPGRPGGVSNDSRRDRHIGASNGNGRDRPVGASNGSGRDRPVGASNGSGRDRPVSAINGTGPGRPVAGSSGTVSGRPAGPKAVTSKMPVSKMEKKISAPTARNHHPSAHRTPPSRVHSSDSRKQLEQKRVLQERSKDKMMPQRPPVSLKPQGNKLPVKQLSSQSHMKSNVQRPNKKQLSEDEKALMMIRNMFHSERYPVCDDDDVSDMEANWDEIMQEERRSAKIARKEDEEQLKLIEEEERRERMRRAKKRKLSQH